MGFVLPALFLVGVVSSVVSAVFGMAGGMILLSLLTLFMDLKQAIPLHGIAQFGSNIGRVWAYRREIEWRLAGPFCLLVPLGAYLGAQAVGRLPSSLMELVLGILILSAVWLLPRPKEGPGALPATRRRPTLLFAVLGLGASFLGMIVGATGPMIAPFFFGQGLKKKQLVATKAVCQSASHLAKLPAFILFTNYDFWSMRVWIVVLLAGVAIGIPIGTRIIDRIHEDLYEKLIRIVLTLLALRMVIGYWSQGL